MADASDRFAFPFLQSGQAQKEIFHNEALARIDALLHVTAQSASDDDPPSTPTAGQCWIVGASPTGAWAGRAGEIAAWSDGGWLFVAPRPGMSVWIVDVGLWARYDTSDWIVGEIPMAAIVSGGVQVVGAQQPAIVNPTGGSTVDGEARAAIAALLSAIRAHGLIAT